MNLHEASCRYSESRLKPGKKDERKTATSDIVARLPGAEAVERTRPLYEYFPLGGFQLEHQTRTTVGLNRCRRTQIWKSMRARQPVRNETVAIVSKVFST